MSEGTNDANTLRLAQGVEALQAIARTLNGRTDEESCRILACVATHLGFYEQAVRFNDAAWRFRADAERERRSEP